MLIYSIYDQNRVKCYLCVNTITFESELLECFSTRLSYLFLLIGHRTSTDTVAHVLIGRTCYLFQRSRRISNSGLDNITEFGLTFFSPLWTPEIPFYGRNVRLLRSYYQLPVGCEPLSCFRNICFCCPRGLDFCLQLFPVCLRIFYTTR